VIIKNKWVRPESISGKILNWVGQPTATIGHNNNANIGNRKKCKWLPFAKVVFIHWSQITDPSV
jgi:hypothetical protein